MCGINGIVTKKCVVDIGDRIKKMNDSLAHRGPDADSYKICNEGKLALGHRRLSIIDLDHRSDQPFVSASGRWILVYNGEVYNYKKMRDCLSYDFITESDTEVIIAYIETKGINALLKECNGMFAFAAFDVVENKMYLCRDRMGIKPLYYYSDANFFIFSSEIKGILNSGLVEAVFDTEAIDDYLGYRYIREPYTFFKGIRQLEAGTYLEISHGLDVVQKTYWDIPASFNQSVEYDEDFIYAEFKERLEEAVNKRMIADVPLGTYLSGGVDSSLLSAMAASRIEERGEKLDTYTIGFPELNEFKYARMVSEKYNTRHHEIKIDRYMYLSKLKEIIMYKDAPLGVPNEIPLAVMSGELKKDITVVLSGEGADELLGGYGKIFRAPFDYKNFDSNCGISFYRYFIDKYEYVPRSIRDKYLTTRENRRHFYDEKILDVFGENSNEYNVFRFFHKYHVKGLLQRVDTTTMLASVEARVPFLDHELIEYTYQSVPYELKLKWKNNGLMETARDSKAEYYSENSDIPKYILKKMAYDYLPAQVIERKKEGFPVPLNKWDKELREMAHNELKDSVWFRQDKLQEFFDECGKERIGNQIIWMFLNVEIFYKSYLKKEWRY